MKPFMATFRAQKWVGDFTEDLESTEFDATAALLELSLKEIVEFKHNNYDSDDLASALKERCKHRGPFEVDCDLDGWLEANGVPERERMTEGDLERLRRENKLL